VQELDELRLRGRLHPPHGLARHDLVLSWLASRQSDADTEQLVVLTVMPHTSLTEQVAPAPAPRARRPSAPPETAIGARLAARAVATPKQKQVQFDAAVTVIRPRVDLTDDADDLVLAAGTPRFNEEDAVVERQHEAGSTRPFAVVRLPLPPAPSVNGVTIPFEKLMADGFENDDELTRPVMKSDLDAFGPDVTLIDPLLANLKVKQ